MVTWNDFLKAVLERVIALWGFMARAKALADAMGWTIVRET
jgi:hypothetical protein